jgi:hypothetical protein
VQIARFSSATLLTVAQQTPLLHRGVFHDTFFRSTKVRVFMKKPGVGGFFMTAILTKTEFFCRAVCTTDYTIDECMQRFFLDKLPDDFARGKRLPADARAATDACGAGAPQSTDAKCTAQANAPAAVSGRLHMRRLNERRFFFGLVL